MISKEEAISKRFLQNKRVYLKPVVRGGKMVTAPEHVAYFQYEGASNWFQLPKKNSNGTLVNPFESEAEKEFFEKTLDLDLNIHKKKDNFWHTFFVKVIKDYTLMHDGYVFNLSDPMDNLRWRVIRVQPSVAPSWEERYAKGEYRFALVDEDYEERAEQTQTNKAIDAYTYLGSIQNSIKEMRDFLGVYYMEKKEMKEVSADSDKDWMRKELKKIIESDVDLFLKIIDDPSKKVKNLILQGVRCGAIVKQTRNKYDLPGEGVSYTYDELVDYLTKAEEVKADVYLKLIAQTKMVKV